MPKRNQVGTLTHHTEGKPHQVPVQKTAKSMFQVFAQSLDFFQPQIVNEVMFCIEQSIIPHGKENWF